MSDTAVQNDVLHMVEFWLDMRRLADLARALHLPLHLADDDYLVHCALGELFGNDAPRPFCTECSCGRHLRALAYASYSAQQLHESARAFASPMVYATVDWSRLASKPMPLRFPEGSRLGFQVKVCPVVRKASAGRHHAAGAEVDVFLAEVWEVDNRAVAVGREAVYARWLDLRLAARGAARLLAVRLQAFKLQRMLRRSHGEERKLTFVKRPAGVFKGQLQVTEPLAFAELLRRGLGRHRSFGFGMLKVRRSGG